MRYTGMSALVLSVLLMIMSFAADFGDQQIVLAALSLALATTAMGLLMGSSDQAQERRRRLQ